MAGSPLALSIGVPAATYVGSVAGWRICFALLSAAAILLSIWVSARLPDFPGQRPGSRASISTVVAIPGVLSILFVTLAFVLAHNILYTYIAAFLQRAAIQNEVDTILFVFGCCSLVGILVVGIWIDPGGSGSSRSSVACYSFYHARPSATGLRIIRASIWRSRSGVSHSEEPQPFCRRQWLEPQESITTSDSLCWSPHGIWQSLVEAFWVA
ncbi:hypothetical protein AGRA671_19815 [Agrobacterium radiobacter]|nr:Arabinose efflux permease family protein [Agrobacterium tumefaciens]